LYFAVPGVPASTYGFPNNYQVAAPFAERLQTGLVATAATQRRHRRRRRHWDFRYFHTRRGRLRREAAERLTDDATAFAWPNSGGTMMMMMPLFPPIGGRVSGGERETRSTLTLTV